MVIVWFRVLVLRSAADFSFYGVAKVVLPTVRSPPSAPAATPEAGAAILSTVGTAAAGAMSRRGRGGGRGAAAAGNRATVASPPPPPPPLPLPLVPIDPLPVGGACGGSGGGGAAGGTSVEDAAMAFLARRGVRLGAALGAEGSSPLDASPLPLPPPLGAAPVPPLLPVPVRVAFGDDDDERAVVPATADAAAGAASRSPVALGAGFGARIRFVGAPAADAPLEVGAAHRASGLHLTVAEAWELQRRKHAAAVAACLAAGSPACSRCRRCCCRRCRCQ